MAAMSLSWMTSRSWLASRRRRRKKKDRVTTAQKESSIKCRIASFSSIVSER
jgi:hypothetical protein